MTALPPPHRTDGDGWVDCSCGNRHWGRFGAAGLLLTDPELGVLLQHRASWSHHGDTWGVPGGARAGGESAVAAAVREAAEEAAVVPELVRADLSFVEDHGDWSYTTVVGTSLGPFEPYASDAESHDIRWVPLDEVTERPLLPAFAAMWPRIREQVGRRATLVVDAANVVGSRPDGWWRDRAGATSRLRDQLAAADGLPASALALPADRWWPDVSLVVEGRARGVRAAPGVRVVPAPRSGDDMILAVAATAVSERPRDPVVVATADRELRRRVIAAGATVTGPGALRSALDGGFPQPDI